MTSTRAAAAEAAYASLRVKGEVLMDSANVQTTRRLAAADGLALVQKKVGRGPSRIVWLVSQDDRTTIVRPDAS
jgi:hypothetical protein